MNDRTFIVCAGCGEPLEYKREHQADTGHTFYDAWPCSCQAKTRGGNTMLDRSLGLEIEDEGRRVETARTALEKIIDDDWLFDSQENDLTEFVLKSVIVELKSIQENLGQLGVDTREALKEKDTRAAA